MSAEIRILNAPADLFRAAATEFGQLAAEAVRARSRFTVALAGGSTPKSLYELLAGAFVPHLAWDKIYFFWGDERQVPPNHPESNYRMANEAMLSKVPVPAQNIFRIHGEEKDANAAARAYEQEIKTFFCLQPGEFPRFDLILLGTGPDGHTASLFPGSAALQENSRLVVANYVEKFKSHRITLTLPVLNHAVCVMFLVSGEEKASIVREIVENPSAGLPSQRVRPSNGELVWLLDRAAASALRNSNA